MHAGSLLIPLLQITVILLLSRIMAWAAGFLRQPQVVGEMLAGIMLGPSVLGWLAPHLAGRLFPAPSLDLLNILAQLGVIFFMFLVGLELNAKLLRAKAQAAVLISNCSILVPFVLGVALTWLLYPGIFGAAASFTPVALFMGASMSITAFPVLARILTERELHKTKIGAVTITCAALNDVTAWCILAFVVAAARDEGARAGLITTGLTVVYALLMVLLARPLLRRLEAVYELRHGAPQMLFAAVMILMLLSAAATEWIGIHALFGAFLMGAIMPKGTRFVRLVMEKLEDLTVLFLLPIFFASSGLQTRVGLLNTPYLWSITGLIVAAACIGKFGGAMGAARFTGFHWRESAAIGILMNTRGLVELVILNIGLHMGVINSTVFAMMVIMALATTAMTMPILEWVFPRRMFEASGVQEPPDAEDFRILVPVSRPQAAAGLARVAAMLGGADMGAMMYGLYVHSPNLDQSLGISLQIDRANERSALEALMAEAKHVKIPAQPLALVSRDVASDIAHVARDCAANLVLIGSHKAVIGQTILGGAVHRVLTGTDADVAIFFDRGLDAAPKILVPYQGSAHDRLAVQLARRMGAFPGASVTILHVARGERTDSLGAVRKESFPDSVQVWIVEDQSPLDAVLRVAGEFNLIVVGLAEEWGLTSHLFGFRAERIAEQTQASLLLVRKFTPIKTAAPAVKTAKAVPV